LATGEGVPDAIRHQIATHCEVAIKAGVEVDIVAELGQPYRHILDCADRLPADLIVMGTHGTGGFMHLVLGSVTERVLRSARCPVLTVPPRAEAASRLPFQRVLCALDFTDPSLAGLEFAVSLAQESGAGLTMVHVLEWPWPEPPAPAFEELPPSQAVALAEFRRHSEESAEARLRSLVPETLAHSHPPSVRVCHGKPYVEVLRIAAERSVDLIVIGVHGRNQIDMDLFGSTTNQVVRRATCPVLTVRR
jgi:nucleotide-binding universal stress UspA family protein